MGNNGEAGDLWCHRAHYNAIVMCVVIISFSNDEESFLSDMITYQCPNLNSGLAKAPLKIGYGCAIALQVVYGGNYISII